MYQCREAHGCARAAHVGGTVAKAMLQLIDHQSVAVSAQALQSNGGARHVAAQALQLSPIAGLAGDGRIEREAVPPGGEGLRLLPPRPVECGSRGVQAKRLAPRDGADSNPVAAGGALELREHILALGVEVEPELFLVVILLRDQRATSHERASDATDERVEGALELERRRRRCAMETRAVAVEGVHAVERENMDMNVEIQRGAVPLYEGHQSGLGLARAKPRWQREVFEAGAQLDVWSHGSLSHGQSAHHDHIVESLRQAQVLCVDEGHNFLNLESNRTRLLLRNMADHVLLFTATPINRSVVDLLRIADTLGADNLEPSTLKAFGKMLRAPNPDRTLTDADFAKARS